MSDLDDLKANAPQVQSEAYGKTESPAAQKQKDRTDERERQREQRRLDRINKELHQQRQTELRKFSQEARPAAMPAPIPLAGDQNVRRFSETPPPPAPDEWRMPIKSDATTGGSDSGTTKVAGIKYDSGTDTFTAITADVAMTNVATYTG